MFKNLIKNIIDDNNIDSKNRTSILQFLDDNKYNFSEINSYGPEDKKKILQIISKLDFPHEEQYSQLYFKLAEIEDLWCLDSNYNIPLISYFCYNYHSCYYDCIMKLSKNEKIWYIKNLLHHYTPLSFLICVFRDYKRDEVFDIIENLVQYKNLWLQQDINNNTPLHELCLYKNIEIINVIVNFKEEKYWNIINKNKTTPLHNLCLNYNLKNKEMAEFLINLSKFKNLWIIKDEFGYTPLHLLTRYMYDNEIYKLFFDVFENDELCWNIKNNSNKTPKDLYVENLNKDYVIL
jgi:hypothetical protein